EFPIVARRLRIIFHRHFAQCFRVEPEALIDFLPSDDPSLVTRQLCSGLALRQLMSYLPHRAVSRNGDAPFLGAIDNVCAFEARVTHLPHRRRKPAPDQMRVRVVPAFAPHELVPEPGAIFRRELGGGRLLPFGPERDRAILERGIGGRFGLGPVDFQRRRVAVEVSTKCYRQQSRNSKRWQCALDKSSPAPCTGADACRGGLCNRSAALPRSVPECRRQLQPSSCAYPVKGD